jgi:exosortase
MGENDPVTLTTGSTMTPSTRLPWTRGQLVLALVLAGLAVGAMWSAWCDWAWISYMDAEHSHVFLVVPFAAAIVYVNREKFARMPAQRGASWVGPLIVLGALLMAHDGYFHNRRAFFHMGTVLVALGGAITALGSRVLFTFWQATLLLGFIVPMPNTLRLKIAFPLQTWMAAITEHVVNFFGQGVVRQGNSLIINGNLVNVVESCNGLRLVFTLILVSWLFAFVTPIKTWVRWTVVVLSPVIALVCNVIRLVPTLYLHGHASRETADTFHEVAGWCMIPLSFFMLMGVISLIEAFGVDVREEKPVASSE